MFEFEFLRFEYPANITPKEKREYEHNLAYSLLDKLLKSKGVTSYEFIKNENGKPFLKDIPIFFSISHSDGFCAVCISSTPVGIDCEKIDPSYGEKIELFASRYFNESEALLLKNSQNKVLDFFKIWTAKEAYIKKLGLNGSYIKKIDTLNEEVEYYIEGEYIISILK